MLFWPNYYIETFILYFKLIWPVVSIRLWNKCLKLYACANTDFKVFEFFGCNTIFWVIALFIHFINYFSIFLYLHPTSLDSNPEYFIHDLEHQKILLLIKIILYKNPCFFKLNFLWFCCTKQEKTSSSLFIVLFFYILFDSHSIFIVNNRRMKKITVSVRNKLFFVISVTLRVITLNKQQSISILLFYNYYWIPAMLLCY